MHPTAQLFYDIGEPYAAGLFEHPEKGYFYRHSLAMARYYEALEPAVYEGEPLYPAGRKTYDRGYTVAPGHAWTYSVNWEALGQKSREAAVILGEFHAISRYPDSGGWTHSAPNYKRILKEGLASYRERVLARPEGEEFREGLLALLDGMEIYLKKCADYLRGAGAPERLVKAVEKVPFAPAESFFEAIEAWNLIFYFDDCDNLGCLDDGLIDYWDGGDYTDLIEQLFINIDTVGHWSCTIGHSYNAITEQALRAIRGHRRPMLELMVDDDMPESLWELAVETIRSGCTNPSFYNKRGIYDMLKKRFPQIPDNEIALFCGCGCTETTLQGISRCGGTDGNVPLLQHLETWLFAHLTEVSSFEEFYEGLCAYSCEEIDRHLDRIIGWYEYMAKYLPHPMRTLFTDDCIDKGLDFNGGGARYTWTQSSDSGLINVIDSLLAIRELVFRKKKYAPQEFLDLLAAEDAQFYAELKKCPHFGVDDEDADALAQDYVRRMYAVYHDKKPGGFIDGCILTEHQFSRYERQGLLVGPTPDGRHRGQPTCDSIAALRGKAGDGPTAMLKSASKLPMAEGISVLNLTLAKNFAGKALEPLVKSYFTLGGIQVQVTCTSAEELQDALAHPDKYPDLIVRVGGYSEYFQRLTPALRQAVVERNVHELG